MNALLCLSAAVALSLTEPTGHAEALVPLLDAPAEGAYAQALAGWQECGKAAVPVLQALLADEARIAQHRDLLDCLVRAGGTAAIPVLQRMLGDEQVYWNNLGMNLDEPAKLSGVR